MELEIQDNDTTCSLCYAEFLDPDDLAVHMKQMHSKEKESTYKLCQFCTKYLSDLEEYALHLRDEHVVNLKCCKYCTRVFSDFDQYRKHESKHYTFVAKSLYSCSQCEKLFSNISELELHELREHYDCQDGVYINECLPMLSSVLNIKALKFLQSIGDEVDYTCVRCEMSSPYAHDYIKHLQKKQCRSVVCNSCSSVYRNKKGLIRHVDAHPECNLGGKQVYKQCMECYKMYDIRMWKDHTKHCKAIKCKMCKVVFSSMYELSKHQTTAHPLTVSLIPCKYCQKEFAGSFSLKKHMERAHKNDAHLYKYRCTCCNAIFKHPKKLFAHFYSTHKDLEPYTCKICDKKFKIRKKFTIHIKLDHKSIGYIEFDENYHVFFSDKKTIKTETQAKVEKTEDGNEQPNSENIDTEENLNECQKEEYVNVKEEQRVERTLNAESKAVKFDSDTKFEVPFVNANADFASATETEGMQTEAEEKPVLKRKIKMKMEGKLKKRHKTSEVVLIDSDSSEDKPLVELRKRVRKDRRNKLRNASWNRKKRKDLKDNKKRFICNICSKYCYTFQNYHNHVALHYKNVTLKCVKCSETFSSKESLNKHYAKKHSSSQLTQTLKNLLEKRKYGAPLNSNLSSAEKFQRTIKRVELPLLNGTAKLTEVKDKLSVQKFIENFTPEDGPKKIPIKIDFSVTLKEVTGPSPPSFIKMTKCNLTHMNFNKIGLCMPVRFRQVIGETHKVTIKEVEVEEEDVTRQNFEDETYFDDDNVDRNESIPDVAQEVMLEVTEEPTPKALYIPHRVVLPKLPKEINKIRIAHLQAEAPYYKIVKVEDVLNPQPQEDKKKPIPEPPVDKKMDIKLPDGTKLVTVNPLAHLLGDTPVENILQKNKYYQPKSKDFEVAIAKAMLRLEKPEAYPKRRKKKTRNEIE